jgi:hypothetical protein
MKLTHAFWFLIAILLAIQPLRVKAHDHDHPELDQWFKSLTNQGGGSCCDGSDAYSVLAVDWEHTDDAEWPFKVLFQGKWLKVNKSSLVKGVNKTGISKLWPVQQTDDGGEPVGEWAVRCFMPGSES